MLSESRGTRPLGSVAGDRSDQADARLSGQVIDEALGAGFLLLGEKFEDLGRPPEEAVFGTVSTLTEARSSSSRPSGTF